MGLYPPRTFFPVFFVVCFFTGGGPLSATAATSKTPVISGDARETATLSTTTGMWPGSPTSFAFRWERCDAAAKNCDAISGATKRTYKLGAADVGHRVRAVVSIKGKKTSASAASVRTSSPTGKVVAVKRPKPTPAPAPVTPPAPAPTPAPTAVVTPAPPVATPTAAPTAVPTPTATATPTPAPTTAPMAVISRNAPAFTNDDCDGGYPARNADDANYTSRWFTCDTAVSASNAKWLAYDLSGVSAAKRGQVVVAWFNDPITGAYDHTVINNYGYNNPAAYTLEVNSAAGGGAAPTSGWTTVATVAGNTYNARQHLVDLDGANWLRFKA